MWYFLNTNSIGSYIKKLLIFILGVALLLVYGSGIMLLINKVINFSITESSPLIISISTLNIVILMIIPALTLFLIFIYFTYKGYSKASKLVPVYSGLTYVGMSRKKKASITYNLTFIILIILNMFIFLYFINDYTVVYKDKIQKHNLLSFKSTSYDYKDIKEVSIGSKRRRNGGTFYYVVSFNDNKKANIAATNLSKNSTLDCLVQINEIVKNNKIPRKVDKKNFHNLVQDLGEEYVEKYEELFKK